MRCAMGGNRARSVRSPGLSQARAELSFRLGCVCRWAPSVLDEASEANELKVIIRHVYFLFAYGL